MLQGIVRARATRFLLAAMVLPGYLAIRIPFWLRRLKHRPLLALMILAIYLAVVSLAMRSYLRTQRGQLDRARWVT